MPLSRLTLTLPLMLLLTGCATVNASDSAICAGLNPLVDSHANALIIDGGPQSLVTGDKLITGYDAGCSK
jgi:hypothetical protein